jgi:hypothetical protein
MEPMMPARRTVLIGACVALAVGACTTREEVPQRTRSGTSIVASTAPEIAVTDASTRDDAASETSSPAPDSAPSSAPAVEPPSSAPPPSISVPEPTGEPTSTPTEFVVGGEPDGWLLLGRWTGTDWQQADADASDGRDSAIGSGVAIGVHELGVAPIAGTTGGAAPACFNGRSGPTITPNARAPQDPGFGFRAVAFTADWNPRPRSIAVVAATVDAYVEAGRAAFAGTVVDAVDGAVSQVVVSDLDGDGDSESLVTFGGGGYSALLLIDADSGTSLTIARSVSRGTASAGSPPVDYDAYRILAVVDMNGDGLMEFVVHSWRGPVAAPISTATANTYDGSAVSAVLSTSC